MDLPTYTNIWRIEKRLYKLYDFRLPAPLPITWIAVFVGITVPYIFFLVVIGLPFNHNLVWLYVLPPGVLTWLTTRPVIESKRLPELVSSQLRYLSEPRTWCRLTPFAEKDDVSVSVRVWHRHPPGARPKKARPEKARKAAGRGRSAGRAPETAAAPAVPVAPAVAPAVPVAPAVAPAVASRAAEEVAASQARVRSDRRPPSPYVAAPRRPLPARSAAPEPGTPLPVPQRATDRPEAKRVRVLRAWQRGPEPDQLPPTPVDEARPDVVQRRPSWAVPPSERRQDSRTLEVSHDPEPDPRDLGQPGLASFTPPAWPEAGAGAFPQIAAFPEAGPFPEVGAFPEVGPFPEVGAFPEVGPFPEVGASRASRSRPVPRGRGPSGARGSSRTRAPAGARARA